LQGTLDKHIETIAYDSRKVKKNSLFVCIKGFESDGHDFIDQAVAQGASALLVERSTENIPENVTVIQVANTRNALAYVAANFYGHADENFCLIGITGTKGKTSVADLINKVLVGAGIRTGLIGSNGAAIDGQVHDFTSTTKTTPESLELHKLFYEMSNAGVECVVLEVSSHALELCRVDYCAFDKGVFTNISPDHLDFHGAMERYEYAKRKLFLKCKTSIINRDDALSQKIISENKNIVTYSAQRPADIYASNIVRNENLCSFTVHYDDACAALDVALPGRTHVHNVLAAFASCYHMNIAAEKIIGGLEI